MEIPKGRTSMVNESPIFSYQTATCDLEILLEDNGELSESGANRGKKKIKRKLITSRKTKGESRVLKGGKEAVNNSTTSDTTNTLEDLEQFQQTSNSSEDDSYLTHIVLSRILNSKKLELMESEEIIKILSEKTVNN